MNALHTNPFERVPVEVTVLILASVDLNDLANLSRVSRYLHRLIETHQNHIYRQPGTIDNPNGQRNLLAVLTSTQSIGHAFKSLPSFKDVCRVQTILRRQWLKMQTYRWDTLTGIDRDAMQASKGHLLSFTPDFRHRVYVCRFSTGHVTIYDMQTSKRVWDMPSAYIRPQRNAFTRYSDGFLIQCAPEGLVEVWKLRENLNKPVKYLPQPEGACSDEVTLHRSSLFLRLKDDTGYLGFLVHKLAGSSTQSQEDMEGQFFEIGRFEESARLNSVHDGDIVVTPMASGFQFFNTNTKTVLGSLRPDSCNRYYHVDLPIRYSGIETQHLCPLQIAQGPMLHGVHRRWPLPPIDEDSWDLACIEGTKVIGMSSSGRVSVCTDWCSALDSANTFHRCTSIIDTDSMAWGPWTGSLALRGNRLAYLTQSHVCTVTFDQDGCPLLPDRFHPLSSWTVPSFVPKKGMVFALSLHDDCIIFGRKTSDKEGPRVHVLKLTLES